jgi:lipopolysaccharide export system protein LptA
MRAASSATRSAGTPAAAARSLQSSGDAPSDAASSATRMTAMRPSRASCDKAVYTRATEQLVLTGNARLLRGENSVIGDRIDIWLNDERMEVTPGTVVFKPATVQNKPEPEPIKPIQP